MYVDVCLAFRMAKVNGCLIRTLEMLLVLKITSLF